MCYHYFQLTLNLSGGVQNANNFLRAPDLGITEGGLFRGTTKLEIGRVRKLQDFYKMRFGQMSWGGEEHAAITCKYEWKTTGKLRFFQARAESKSQKSSQGKKAGRRTEINKKTSKCTYGASRGSRVGLSTLKWKPQAMKIGDHVTGTLTNAKFEIILLYR